MWHQQVPELPGHTYQIFKNLFVDLKSWNRQPQTELNSQGTWRSVGEYFNMQKLPTIRSHTSPTSRQVMHMLTSCCGCCQFLERYQKCLSILQMPEWPGRLLVVWRGRGRLLKLNSHPPCCFSRVCPNCAISWGYWAGWRSTRFAPTSAQLAQPSPIAVSEAMGRHKPLPTTRNIKYHWSQCVLVRVGSHDNSAEAGERALNEGGEVGGGKGVELSPSWFWRSKGVITNRNFPALSYHCFSDHSVETFLRPHK